MTYTDTHSHLYDSAFDADRDEAVERALAGGVERIFLPAIDSQSHDALFDLSRSFPDNCFPMMGLHPTSANDNPGYIKELDLVEKYLASPPTGIDRFYAIGEVGLDLHWSKDWLAQQTEVFEKQIELSVQYALPLVIHTRTAWPQMVETLYRHRSESLRGIMHSFSGSYADYSAIKDCGDFLFGIGGVVTYKNSEIAEMLPRIPLEDIVLETDCPYLTPVPYRGKRNESGYIPIIAAKVAEITGFTQQQVADVTTANAMRMFGIG